LPPFGNLYVLPTYMDRSLAQADYIVFEAASHTDGKRASVGWTLMENLKSFTGSLYPVNPKRRRVLGLKAFPRIGEVPAPVDLAVIAIPAIAVSEVVSECAEAGVKGAVIISAETQGVRRRWRTTGKSHPRGAG
jgi:acyl-CoA synthetase (NDP forming)